MGKVISFVTLVHIGIAPVGHAHASIVEVHCIGGSEGLAVHVILKEDSVLECSGFSVEPWFSESIPAAIPRSSEESTDGEERPTSREAAIVKNWV